MGTDGTSAEKDVFGCRYGGSLVKKKDEDDEMMHVVRSLCNREVSKQEASSIKDVSGCELDLRARGNECNTTGKRFDKESGPCCEKRPDEALVGDCDCYSQLKVNSNERRSAACASVH